MTNWYGKELIKKVENCFFTKKQLIPIEIKAQAEPKELKRNEDDQDHLCFDNTYSNS